MAFDPTDYKRQSPGHGQQNQHQGVAEADRYRTSGGETASLTQAPLPHLRTGQQPSSVRQVEAEYGTHYPSINYGSAQQQQQQGQPSPYGQSHDSPVTVYQQHAPRQRTAVACHYCRRRKVGRNLPPK